MKILKFFTCILLVASLLAAVMMPIGAARVTYYLSDLKLAEADTAEEAKRLLTDAGFTVIDKDLNPGGAKSVYLGYKKTTKVDDAITDVRVMNMNGGFNVSDYETIKNDALEEYSKTVDNFRIAAKEFAENYKAGKREALLAYRQLNYYYVEKKGVKTNMGDYMLNFPAKNDDFADILFKGNPTILNNIRNLLAMGVSDGGALIDRIKAAVADEEVYDKKQYFEDAKELVGKTLQLKKLLNETNSRIEEIKADTTMTEEEKETALIIPQYTALILMAFDEILKDIPKGDSNYSEYFNKKNITDYSVLYPFVDAMTPGQKAMAVSGQLHAVLTYNVVEMSDTELENELNKLEENYEPLSVYLGTDMDLLEGAVGVTSEALREQAATGNQWFACFTDNMAADIAISALFGAGGATIFGISVHYLKAQLMLPEPTTIPSAMNLKERAMVLLEDSFDDTASVADVNTASSVSSSSDSTVATVFAGVGAVLGVAMLVFSIYSIGQIMSKYLITYTAIPSNMVDTVETVNGNRYVNYKVVNSRYNDGSKITERPGDTNGYNGEQWNAIYYTKSYEAGKCMTANAYVIDSASNFGRYTPVAKFGLTNCYDLNSFNGNKNGDQIFLAFGNSNNKKSAETSVPTVVGSVFTYGAMALSTVIGFGIGVGAMALIKRKKEKENKA